MEFSQSNSSVLLLFYLEYNFLKVKLLSFFFNSSETWGTVSFYKCQFAFEICTSWPEVIVKRTAGKILEFNKNWKFFLRKTRKLWCLFWLLFLEISLIRCPMHIECKEISNVSAFFFFRFCILWQILMSGIFFIFSTPK